jgi:hypothetical protein
MRFSTQTAKGIDRQDQVALETGIASLKTYMIINGVFAIIGLIGGYFQLITLINILMENNMNDISTLEVSPKLKSDLRKQLYGAGSLLSSGFVPAPCR